MAFETGTATNYTDLFDKLLVFLTSVPIHGSEVWAINAQTATRAYLQGPGLSASDEVYVSIDLYEDIGNDYFNWEVRGADGYTGGLNPAEQLNASFPTHLLLWDSTITYWFIASGRRFIVVAKVSTTYHVCYAGLFLPFALPSQYPYPVAIGASTGSRATRWSDSTAATSNVFDPAVGSLYMRDSGGSWHEYVNIHPATTSNTVAYHTHPFISANYQFLGLSTQDGGGTTDPEYILSTIREDAGGSYELDPITMLKSSIIFPASPNVYGEFDGAYVVTGFGNASENTVTVGADSYLVVQNIFRTSLNNYVAIKLA